MVIQIPHGESHVRCVSWAYNSLVKFIFLGIFLICSFSFIRIEGSSSKIDIREKLLLLSKKEQLYLNHFFRTFIQLDALGYTIFGTKPICLTAYFPKVPIGNILFGESRKFVERGWQVWKKIESHFPHPNFLIFEETTKVEDLVIQSIYVINKRTTLAILDKNKPLFQRELGKNFEANLFLEKIEREKALFTLLKNHEGLFGILLGYGIESAMQYHRREQIKKIMLPLAYNEILLYPTSNEQPQRSAVEAFIDLIPFVGNPKSEEVRAIVENNKSEREYIQTLYSKGNFLEITLHALMQP